MKKITIYPFKILSAILFFLGAILAIQHETESAIFAVLAAIYTHHLRFDYFDITINKDDSICGGQDS